jgi:hypothetical protein
MLESEVRTAAWLLMGATGSTPGVLQYSQGRLSFTAYGRGALTGGQLAKLEQVTLQAGLQGRLESGWQSLIFDAPRTSVGRIKFPWYHFGGGMNIVIGEVPYRFSFLEPQNVKFDHDVSLRAITHGRAAGRMWKTALC